MPTDDERRRVAAALREYASFDCECEDNEDCLVDCADWGERVLNLLYRDGEDRTEGEYYARLADLIEPSESGQNQDIVPMEPDGVLSSHACDCDALLALADEMDDACPESASVAIGYIDDYARRIREALGVVG